MNNPPVILLVDDEPEIIKIYETKLVLSGYKVISATSGPDGIAMAKKEHPDLILLDVKMPGMSGLDVFYALKEDQELKDTPIAFLTAFSDPAMPEVDLRIAKGIGATDFIKKGISLDEFAAKVNGYFRQ